MCVNDIPQPLEPPKKSFLNVAKKYITLEVE